MPSERKITNIEGVERLQGLKADSELKCEKDCKMSRVFYEPEE